MIYEFFRWVAIICGFPTIYLCYFTPKIFYEDKKVQSRYIRGGALVISNHFSVMDYMMNLFVVLPRKLNVITSEIPYKSKWLTFGMRFFGGIKVDRISKSMKFMDDAIAVLRKGQLVQIFPEGRNTPDGQMHPFKPSYLMIALRAGVPIVPIITDGNYGLFKRAHVIIGKPIDLSEYTSSVNPTREEIVAMNDAVYHKALALKEQLDQLSGRSKGTV